MERVYNFSAGPSMLPLDALKKAQDQLLNCNGVGMSVMEMSHRSKPYEEIHNNAISLIKELMNVPDNYKILFIQGGASMQFAMVPLNLFRNSRKADIVITGQWSKKAEQEISRFGQTVKIASSADKTFSYIPELHENTFSPDADFFHITLNNTIYGTRYTTLPDTGNVPLVADISSNIMSEDIDVSKFGLLYAGAQKNMGPAGVAIVIVREDLLGNALDITPTMLNYQTYVNDNSLYNTPPTFAIYMCGLVCQWVKDNGGVSGISKLNHEKSALLYDFLDNSSLFKGTVAKKDRSLMNIPFVTGNDEVDSAFVKQAAAAGFVNLKGHRSVGGMRASIYNAMPKEGVEKLVQFMGEFEKNYKEGK